VAFAAYPKQLTDPIWKKVEKAAGVSDTGVGQTLRDAEKVYATLATAMATLEAGKTDAKKVQPAQKAAAAALTKTAKTLGPVVAKVKNAEKKKFLAHYQSYVEHVAKEITAMDLEDRRGLKIPLDRYNERVVMWTKWSDIKA